MLNLYKMISHFTCLINLYADSLFLIRNYIWLCTLLMVPTFSLIYPVNGFSIFIVDANFLGSASNTHVLILDEINEFHPLFIINKFVFPFVHWFWFFLDLLNWFWFIWWLGHISVFFHYNLFYLYFYYKLLDYFYNNNFNLLFTFCFKW